VPVTMQDVGITVIVEVGEIGAKADKAGFLVEAGLGGHVVEVALAVVAVEARWPGCKSES
jgi:hypothetical protein